MFITPRIYPPPSPPPSLRVLFLYEYGVVFLAILAALRPAVAISGCEDDTLDLERREVFYRRSIKDVMVNAWNGRRQGIYWKIQQCTGSDSLKMGRVLRNPRR